MLAQLLQCQAPAETRRGLQLETLEGRQMLAGDVELFSTDSEDSANPNPGDEAALFDDSQSIAQGEQGQPSPDLVAFARLITERGVILYAADWCPVCTAQKDLFEDGQNYLNIVEVTDRNQQLNAEGIANDIDSFPTWVFDAETRFERQMSLQEIADVLDVEIPLSESPTFVPIPNQSVAIGSPIHIPIDAYDPDGQPLTVTAQVADPNLLEAVVLQGNRSLRLDMQGYGDMVFELFEQRAPRATGQVISLAESGFYDGLTFHRVIDTFVLQGGDPSGDGTGSSDLPDFDDQFHPDLQHTNSGILSFAKSNDDTNNSQFFITESNTQSLDFNHSVFGQLVEGEDVREGISRVATTGGDENKPLRDVVINKATIFSDTENSVVMLRPTGNGTGTTSVTFTVRDADGHEFSQIVQVTVGPDNVDGLPYLADIEPVVSSQGTPAQFQLQATDVENDDVVFIAQAVNAPANTNVTVTSGGLVTVTPPASFSGVLSIQVEARAPDYVIQRDKFGRIVESNKDVQRLNVLFTAGAPTQVDLDASTDTGNPEDNITRAGSLIFNVSGVTAGSEVELLAGDQVIGIGQATSSTISITTNSLPVLGNGTFNITARQRGADGVNSPLSPPLTVVFDSLPPAAITTTVPAQANVGTQYTANLNHPEEGSAVSYSLGAAPAGMTIDATTGLVEWTPTASQVGSQTFEVVLTDLAGNPRSQSFNLNVEASALSEIVLGVTNLNGSAITSINAGEEFFLTIAARDLRSALAAEGVLAAFTDVTFDSNLASPSGTDPIVFPTTNQFPQGTASPGLIDEVGGIELNFNQANPILTLQFASVRMRADQAGLVTFVADPADGDGTDLLLVGREDRISNEQVAFGSVSLQINPNFEATNDTASVAENSSRLIDVLANDAPTGNTTLSIVSVTDPNSGGTTSVVDGQVRYTPATDFSGTDTFTYVVTDGSGAEQTATVTVTVTPSNDPATAVDDTFEIDAGSTGNRLTVLANDSPASLVITGVSGTSGSGTVTIESGGKALLYTPANASFTGTETFTYTVSDGTSTSQASVTVNVSVANPPPTAVDDAFTVVEDAAEAEFDVLDNDSNSDSSETFELTAVSTSANARVLRLSEDRTKIIYAPAADFFGTDEVTYTITDSNGASATATITFTVTGENDPPPARAFSSNITKGTSNQTVFRIANAGTNVDGASEALTISQIDTTTTNGGSASIAQDQQSILYTPPSATFVGTDQLTYTIRDAEGLTSSATLTINVLDFVPRSFSVELNAPNVRIPLQARLVGTTEFGDPIDVPAAASSTPNRVDFPAQAPGNYRIEIPAIPFLIGGETPRVIEFSSGPNESDMTLEVDGYNTLHPSFYRLRDDTNSAPQQAAFTGVKPGEEGTFVIAAGSLTNTANPVISLNEAGTSIEVRANGSNGAPRTGTAAVGTNSNAVEVRATSGEFRLLLVNLADSAITFDTPSSAASSTQESSNTGSGSSSTFADNDSQAQGESASLAGGAVPLVTLGRAPSIQASPVTNTLATLETAATDHASSELAAVAARRTAAIDSALSEVASPGQQPSTAETILTSNGERIAPEAVDDALSLLGDS